jgi:hypothetical protein
MCQRLENRIDDLSHEIKLLRIHITAVCGEAKIYPGGGIKIAYTEGIHVVETYK